MANNQNSGGMPYPLTKMNFFVSVDGGGTAAFNEVTGIDASVDVVEFRQGNSGSLTPVKIPGLVHHGNITLKFGYTVGNEFKNWVIKCCSDNRGEGFDRHNVTIELINIQEGGPTSMVEAVGSGPQWVLTDAWVAKYNAPDLNATTSEVAIESVEIAYELLQIPN